MRKSHIRFLVSLGLLILIFVFLKQTTAASGPGKPSPKREFTIKGLRAPRINPRRTVARHSAKRDKDPLTLTIVLNRTDQQGFDAFLSAVQNPLSPMYRQYLTPQEQAGRFGPSRQAYEVV